MHHDLVVYHKLFFIDLHWEMLVMKYCVFSQCSDWQNEFWSHYNTL